MSAPVYDRWGVAVYQGDCLDVLGQFPDDHFAAVVTDPPYSYRFMNRTWDAHESPRAFQEWCERWAIECLRVLKPGGHLLAFGGTRTYHRLTCGIEDAGFTIRDSIDSNGSCISWVYGNGMPKALSVDRAIDQELCSLPRPHLLNPRPVIPEGAHVCPETEAGAEWRGWETALKPAHEPVVVARKPFRGSVAANVLEHGTGALNIDATRVTATGRPRLRSKSEASRGTYGNGINGSEAVGTTDQGRWPPNVVLSHPPLVDPTTGEPVGDACADGCVEGCPVRELDQQSGDRPGFASGGDTTGIVRSEVFGDGRRRPADPTYYPDSGGASRFMPCFRHERKCALWGMLSVCEGHVSVALNPSLNTDATRGSVASPVLAGTEPISGDTRESSEERANNAELTSNPTPATTGDSAPSAVVTKVDEHSVQRVKSAANLCDSCATAIVQSVAAMPHDRDLAQTLGLPSIAESAYSTLTRSLAYVAEDLAKPDTTQTTVALTTSCGYVVHVIKESIIKERSSQRSASDPPPFIWASKAPTHERPRVAGEAHNTVKPLALMRWLARLVTPPDGLVLDPFAGSGPTGQAARAEGHRAVLIEKDPSHIPFIVARLDGHPREDKPVPGRPAGREVQLDLFGEE